MPCRPTRRWRSAPSTLLIGLALLRFASAPAWAQTETAWRQPAADAPSYWELIGRVFPAGDTRASARSLRSLAGPAVMGVGSFPLAQAGEPARGTVTRFAFDEASLATRTRVKVRDLLQVRASRPAPTQGRARGPATGPVRVERRRAAATDAFQLCVDEKLKPLAPLLDGRARAIDACTTDLAWSAWEPASDVPATGGAVDVADGVRLQVAVRPDGSLAITPLANTN